MKNEIKPTQSREDIQPCPEMPFEYFGANGHQKNDLDDAEVQRTK